MGGKGIGTGTRKEGIAILLTVLAFFRVSPAAGWLMVPYLLWVSFASALNFRVWRLNG